MKRQHGFSLVELVIALAITGLIATVVGAVVQATVTVPERGGEQVNAAHAIQNAVFWINADGQEAKAATGGAILVLTLPDSSTITYSLSENNLHRTATGDDRIIARGISSASFSVDGRLITMDITATPEGRYEINKSGTYIVNMRPSA
jgi:prepilin-type N-terminal cleavage/methylation domain-containing protein